MCSMSRLTRMAATVAASAVVLTPALTAGSAHADAATLPHADAFYQDANGTYPAVPPVSSKAGEVLASRDVSLTLSNIANAFNPPLDPSDPEGKKTLPPLPIDLTGVTQRQLLYRTQNEQGQPSATVTTVIAPPASQGASKGASKGVVAYLSYYDGLGDSCDPSYTLQSTAINAEKVIIGTLLQSGYTVTVPDFEGQTHDWAAGHEAGWNTLDAIRATEESLQLPESTKVGMIGYSGGSIAGEWAAELQPTYARDDINLVGTAIGGVPANLRHLVDYVDSDADADRDHWFGVIPAATVSLGRAVGQDFSSFLSDYGKQVADEVSDKCIGDFADEYGDKHLSDLVKPGIDFLDQEAVKAVIDRNEMGKGATPSAPMLMVNGRSSDGIGDGVMVADDVKALAANYCRRGVAVKYTELPGLHSAVGQGFMLQGLSYLDKWFRGTATASDYNCAPRVIVHPAPTVRVKGHSHGRKDVVVVHASLASGMKVKVFIAGHKKPVARAVVRSARTTLKVMDHNGPRKTTYRVVVGEHQQRITLR